MTRITVSELQRLFAIGYEVRKFRVDELVRGRPAVPESELREFVDEKYSDVPIEIRRLIVRYECDRTSGYEIPITRAKARRAS